jgi:hypothetical protein
VTEIICEECKETVSDESGFCPECGYPFDNSQPEEENSVVSEADSAPPNTVVTTPLDMILQSLDSLRIEMADLKVQIDENGRQQNSCVMQSDEDTQKKLMEISARIATIAAVQETMKAALQPDDNKKPKRALLTAFYKTLNSPNSMFEYMFYLCVVQIIFVIVILFLAAYIVTLVQ